MCKWKLMRLLTRETFYVARRNGKRCTLGGNCRCYRWIPCHLRCAAHDPQWSHASPIGFPWLVNVVFFKEDNMILQWAPPGTLRIAHLVRCGAHDHHLAPHGRSFMRAVMCIRSHVEHCQWTPHGSHMDLSALHWIPCRSQVVLTCARMDPA